MPQNFWQWIDEQLERRGWTDRRLSIEAGISPSVISKGRKEDKPVGWEAGVAIANALQVPPELVLRLLGILPAGPKWRPEFDEWNGLFSELTPEDQAEMLALARMKRERVKKKVKG